MWSSASRLAVHPRTPLRRSVRSGAVVVELEPGRPAVPTIVRATMDDLATVRDIADAPSATRQHRDWARQAAYTEPCTHAPNRHAKQRSRCIHCGRLIFRHPDTVDWVT